VCVVLLAVLLIGVVTVNPPKVVNLGKISAHLRREAAFARDSWLQESIWKIDDDESNF